MRERESRQRVNGVRPEPEESGFFFPEHEDFQGMLRPFSNPPDVEQEEEVGVTKITGEGVAQRKLQNAVSAQSEGPRIESRPSDKVLPAQMKENQTGMPDQLKSGLETLGKTDLSDVRVHYNSDKPAQLKAEAFAQGKDIHLAPGKEHHLPHEGWHVIQQKAGRVQPTMDVNGAAVNDSPDLEQEADDMGAKALQLKADNHGDAPPPPDTNSGFFDRNLTVQRVISIEGNRFTHGSRQVHLLFSDVVVPRLEELGYKTYGIKSQLIAFIRNTDQDYDDNDAFWDAFFAHLQTQTRNVKNGTTPVLKPFDVGKMSRPSWPRDYFSMLGFQSGDNIRHVVRNATLKNVLAIEYNNVRAMNPSAVKPYFTTMAEALGVSIKAGSSIDVVIPAIYKALYLNRANLFAGDGPTNQVIGFAADPLHNMGEDLIAQGNTAVNPFLTAQEATTILIERAKATGNSDADTAAIIEEISSVLDQVAQDLAFNITGGKGDLQNVTVAAEEIGEIISEIGLSLGFDMIDGRVPEDQTGIADRQATLIRAETALQEFISTSGHSASLCLILNEFLHTKIADPSQHQDDSGDPDALPENAESLLGEDEASQKSASFSFGAGLGLPSVDDNLAAAGYTRQSADTHGHICLIDSIHQLLTYHSVNVNRDNLIEAVRQATGTAAYTMLEIIGAEGDQVLQAVLDVAQQDVQEDLDITVNIQMVMPDNTLVPFLGANQAASMNATTTITMDLLYVNRNHYDPLYPAVQPVAIDPNGGGSGSEAGDDGDAQGIADMA